LCWFSSILKVSLSVNLKVLLAKKKKVDTVLVVATDDKFSVYILWYKCHRMFSLKITEPEEWPELFQSLFYQHHQLYHQYTIEYLITMNTLLYPNDSVLVTIHVWDMISLHNKELLHIHMQSYVVNTIEFGFQILLLEDVLIDFLLTIQGATLLYTTCFIIVLGCVVNVILVRQCWHSHTDVH